MQDIRSIKASDIEQVNILREKIYRMHADARPDIFADEFGDALKNVAVEIIDDSDADLFVMVDTQEDSIEEKIIGYISVSYITEEDTVYFKERKYCYIDELYVLPDFRRKGVAKDLISYMKKICKEKNCVKLYSDVWDFNKNGIQTFKKIGFHPLRHYIELEVSE